MKGVLSLDILRFASFTALSGSTYKLVHTVLKRRFKNLVKKNARIDRNCDLSLSPIHVCSHDSQRGWSAILAGMAAGAVSIIDDPQRRRTLSLFVLARALGALFMTLHHRGQLPTVPYFVTIVFAACQSLIIMCVTHFPELLPQGYYKSILNWSMYYSEEKLQVCTSL